MVHLVETNCQSLTVRSYISAIKTTLKMNNIEISEDQFLLSSLTKACRLRNDCVRTRLPIQKGMLSVILHKVQSYFSKLNQQYLSIMYTTLISTMYYGLFRISEMMMGAHPVLAKDVHIGANKRKFLFVLHTSKTHCKSAGPQLVKVSATQMCKDTGRSSGYDLPCPFHLLSRYAEY